LEFPIWGTLRDAPAKTNHEQTLSVRYVFRNPLIRREQL
jgi:hypothetical protein